MIMPPEKDIQWALEVEKGVSTDEMELYMEWMNGRGMGERSGPRDIRDGCILTGLYVRYGLDNGD